MTILGRVQSLIVQYGTSDAAKVMERLGITVAYVPMTNLRGIYNCIERMPFVAINSNLSEHERKFVEAHELAHYILHRGVNRVFLNRCSYLKTDLYEREANLFAACMLAPFPDEVLVEGETIENLACRVGVRREVAEMYLREALKSRRNMS